MKEKEEGWRRERGGGKKRGDEKWKGKSGGEEGKSE